MQNEYDPDADTYFVENIEKMNDGQRVIFDLISTKITKCEGGVFFLDAIAGAGKMFLSNLLLAFACRTHKIAIATAMSGIAATLLTLGGTFHHQFDVPIPIFENSSSHLSLNSMAVDIIKQASFILIDEVSMMHKYMLELLDRFLKLIMNSENVM